MENNVVTMKNLSTENLEQKNDRGHDLYWMNPVTGKRLHAGKAFYDEKYAEYRLKIDEVCEDKQYYLRSVGFNEEIARFRLEQVIKKNGKFHHREEKGDGYSSSQTDGEIYIDFGGSMKVLVLSFNSKSKKESA